MNGKAVIPLVAGLCVGGLALKIGWSTLQRAQGAQPELTQVWTVKEDLARGVQIQEAALTALKFPAQYVPLGAVRKKEDLIGRVPRMEASAGLPILETMLHPKGTPAGVYVPPGLRAVAVKIDESSGVDGHIEPGSHVDVVGYFMTRRDAKQEIVARTLIENVEVAAVGQKLQPGTTEQADKGGKSKPARAVTLLVKPEFVPKLHLAEQRGKIKLSMRNDNEEGDDRRTAAANTSEDDILGMPKSQQSSLMDKLATMFAANAQTEAELAAAAAAAAKAKAAKEPSATADAAPVAPPPAWVMNVWNGADRQRLGWARMDSSEPMPLDVEQNERGRRKAKAAQPTPSEPPKSEPDQSPAAPTEKNDVNETEQEPEPEELPE